MNEIKEGWGFPISSKKAHYFVGNIGMSLCRKYGFYTADVEQGNDNSPDNCVSCKELKAKRDGVCISF